MSPVSANVGIEEFGGGRIELWIPLVPGVHARVPPGQPLTQGRQALQAFTHWLDRHGLPGPQDLDLVAVERRPAVRRGDYEINATFGDDHIPVGAGQLDQVFRWLAASRDDLLSALADLDDGVLDRQPSAGRTIREILNHLADAEAWYASRLDPREAERAVVDGRAGAPPLERLAVIRDDLETFFRQHFEELTQATASAHGETWTLRKVLRRQVAHERWHTAEIERLAQRFASSAWFEGQGPDQGPAGRGHQDR